MSNDALRDWIADALKRTGKTQRGLARALNIEESAVSKMLTERRQIKAAEVPLIERYLQERAPVVPNGLPPVLPSADGFVEVPVYDLRAAAGAGAVAFEAEPVHYMMFREAFLQRAASEPRNLFVLEISGDSALPTLHDGDQALVDRGQVNPRREGLYVIRIDDVLQVKRLSMHPVNKTLSVKSDNPDYPTHDNIRPEDIALVGRVIWIGRRLG